MRDRALIGGRTLAQDYTDIAAGIGTDVKSLDDDTTAKNGLLQSLNAQEQSVVGVDINEELVKLLDYQRLVEGASKFLSVVNTSLDYIFNITT